MLNMLVERLKGREQKLLAKKDWLLRCKDYIKHTCKLEALSFEKFPKIKGIVSFNSLSHS